MTTPARSSTEQQNLRASIAGLPESYETQSLAVSMAIAEVDQQITTAHAYPRSIDKAMKNILTLATMDEETAKECMYALPRAGKVIPGPSIRLAEIILSQWQNARVGTRVTHVDRFEKFVESEGIFHDLETNVATTARVRRRISDSKGRLLNDDMIMVTSNAAAAIAKRNAILGGVPKAIWRRAYDEVQRVLVGDIRTMALKRDDAIKAFAAIGVKSEQLFQALDIGGLDDIGSEEYATLIGMHQAIRNGDATVEEMFPVKRAPADKPGNLGERLDQLAGDETVDTGAASDHPAPSPESPVASAAAEAAGEGGDEPSPPQDPLVAAAADPAASRKEAITYALHIASRGDLEADDRLEQLDLLQMELTDRMPDEPTFVKTLIETAAKVARKELPKPAAQKYLASLKEG